MGFAFPLSTGNLSALITLFPMQNGSLVTSVGPVFTYCEFPLIEMKRLNDLEWKDMLTWANGTDYLSSWSRDIYAMAAPWAPEYSNVLIPVATMIAVIVIAVTAKISRTRKRTNNLSKRMIEQDV